MSDLRWRAPFIWPTRELIKTQSWKVVHNHIYFPIPMPETWHTGNSWVWIKPSARVAKGKTCEPAIVEFCHGRKKMIRPSEVAGSRSPICAGLETYGESDRVISRHDTVTQRFDAKNQQTINYRVNIHNSQTLLTLSYVYIRTKSQNRCDSCTYVHGICDRNMGL